MYSRSAVCLVVFDMYLNDVCVHQHPWPRWRPMPTPAELIRHIRRVAQKLRPVKHLQHENAMGIGLEAALGGLNHSSAALARSSSIVGGLTSVWAALAMLSYGCKQRSVFVIIAFLN
jgi:hypothetical protein